MSAALDTLRDLRSHALERLRDGEAEWLGRLRDEAFTAFEEQGFPKRRLEDWRGTNLARLEAIRFERIGPREPDPVVVAGESSVELHFIDGHLDSALSETAERPSGVHILSLAEARREAPELLEGWLAGLAIPKSRAMVALQTAFLDDGAVVILDEGVEFERPIRLFFTSETGSDGSSAAFPRILVVAKERSRATIYIEHTADTNADTDIEDLGLTALVSEIYVAAGAQIDFVEVQSEDARRIRYSSVFARVEGNARFDSHVFTLSPGLVRSELDVLLAAPGAQTRMRGFYLGRETAHIDHFTTVDHAAESCTSDEEYRGVLGDQSEGIFRGRVIIRPGSQKTEARQSNPNLLISDGASMDSKPQLEIYADDVRASHGSTTGQLDPDALFFLRARGISSSKAQLLLTRAFSQRIVDDIADPSLRGAVSTRVDSALATLGSEKPSEPGENAR